ncbi:type IV pilin protein [Thalassotalea sp. Y01]|uniref:type IV pilin protein n=1 Tax=Thalassotalea sp. Y01 TaxID=2729613 RepID=UPI00145D37DA|nr:type IV pilin protein [Thalassotalea sp. Y01]NMP14844.1 prepilin-type N-terminal cleavage/methylation domain-containing protein [Thalassotalea sp. Y01]
MRAKGFTLIELMIVVAIVGIIAGIAYPSFADSMMKSRRTDAKTAMYEIAIQQKKLRGNCATYGSSFGSVNNCTAKTVRGSATTDNGYYQLSLGSVTGNAYVITATAQGVQTKDTGCTSMTLTFSASNPKGLKAPSACW